MIYGIREICNVVFKALDNTRIGDMSFSKGAPVLYIDSAKTSTVEGAATTVYAQGGRGNNRLLAWEGERTLTFTVEDALLSPVSFAMLSGAGLIQNKSNENNLVHATATIRATATGLPLPTQQINGMFEADSFANAEIATHADAYAMLLDSSGDFAPASPIKLSITGDQGSYTATAADTKESAPRIEADKDYFVDYYLSVPSTSILEMQIDKDNFGGYYYVEANTLWRDKNGTDHAAELTIPKVKIQSNFSFSMASTGDPSTFTFTMDAFPAKTFTGKKEVLMAIQVLHAPASTSINRDTVFDVPASN